MDRFRDRLRQLGEMHEQERNLRPHHGVAAAEVSEFRQFALHPIVGPNKQGFGSEALFHAGWDDAFRGDPNITARIMLDNWLLYGFEELIGERAVFLNCTRDTLMSGFLSLLPHSAVFKILESVKPDDEVLSVCRSLKAAGYRFALDDFKSPEKMEEFLDLADFIKVDFRHSGRRERACMLRRLKLTSATLIAEKIESEEEFLHAVEEGFGLFQGDYLGEGITCVKKRDSLNPMNCTRILEAVQGSDFTVEELVQLINLESGIECRLLRWANWTSPTGAVINSTRDALEVAGKPEIQKIVTLAMRAASEKGVKPRSIPHQLSSVRQGPDTMVRWIDTGARTRWWHGTGRGNVL